MLNYSNHLIVFTKPCLLKILLVLLLLFLLDCGGAQTSSPTSSRPINYNISPSENSVPLPQFPFPPKASATYEIDRKRLLNSKGITTFGDVGRRLQTAFKDRGYFHTGYYEVPHGFVLISSIEQFESNGKPTPIEYRFTTNIVPTSFSITDILNILSILFKGRTGRFRVIGFMVTSLPFEQGGVTDMDEIKGLSEGGLNQLPAQFGKQIFTEKHYCTALIYEFIKYEGEDKARVVRTDDVMQHLQPILNTLMKVKS